MTSYSMSDRVVTFAVTWIEINEEFSGQQLLNVVTFAVTWIEMAYWLGGWDTLLVVTFAVTWIEMYVDNSGLNPEYRRHLRGDVD